MVDFFNKRIFGNVILLHTTLVQEDRCLNPFTFVCPRTPGSSLSAIERLVATPTFTNSKDVGTPVPNLVLAVAVYPGRRKIQTWFSASGRFRVGNCSQGDMTNIASNSDVKVLVPVLWMQDELDDSILVEITPDQVPDVTFRPRLQVGVLA